MKADVENIVDKSENLKNHTISLTVNGATVVEQRRMFSEIDRAWQSLVETLQTQFGWFDARSVATAARSFARRNRSGQKLSYEQADEIARLQSLIKSYRRRQRDLESWLTSDVRNEYVASCGTLKEAIV